MDEASPACPRCCFVAPSRSRTAVGDLTFAAFSCCQSESRIFLRRAIRLPKCSARPSTASQFAREGTISRCSVDIIAPQLAFIRTLRGSTRDLRRLRRRTVRRASDSSGTSLPIRRSRCPSAGIGSASCRRASLPVTMRRPLDAASKARRLPWSPPSAVRDGGIPFLCRAVPCRMLGCGIDRPAPAAPSRRWPPTTGSSKSGRRIARKTSRNRAALVGAEIARIEGRDARRRCASTNKPSARRGQTASFTTRRSPTNWLHASTRRAASRRSPHTYLRNARYCYLRWGADGKVRQLDEMYPHLQEEEPSARSDRHDRGRRSSISISRP